MPYIKLNEREHLDFYPTPKPTTAGALNYVITQTCLRYFDQNGGRYQQINDIIGALECAKLEFYRRLAAPYEDIKIAENGDVYP
jgi:hypothetical protein